MGKTATKKSLGNKGMRRQCKNFPRLPSWTQGKGTEIHLMVLKLTRSKEIVLAVTLKKRTGESFRSIVKTEKRDCNPVGLSWAWGLSSLPGAFVNGHFWLSKPDIKSSWHLMGREQRCSLMSCCAQDPPHQQRIVQPQMPMYQQCRGWQTKLLSTRGQLQGWGQGKAGNVACLRKCRPSLKG